MARCTGVPPCTYLRALCKVAVFEAILAALDVRCIGAFSRERFLSLAPRPARLLLESVGFEDRPSALGALSSQRWRGVRAANRRESRPDWLAVSCVPTAFLCQIPCQRRHGQARSCGHGLTMSVQILAPRGATASARGVPEESFGTAFSVGLRAASCCGGS